MKDVLLRIVSNSAVRKAFLALVLAALAAAGVSLGTGCGGQAIPPAVAKAAERLTVDAINRASEAFLACSASPDAGAPTVSVEPS